MFEISVLNKRDNNIDNVTPQMLGGLEYVTGFNFSENKIRIIHENVFKNLTMLREICLEGWKFCN
jgi:homoserine kinase